MATQIKKISAKKFFEICVSYFQYEFLREHFRETEAMLRFRFQSDEFTASLQRLADDHAVTINVRFRALLIERLLAIAIEWQQRAGDAVEEHRRAENEQWHEERGEFMDYCWDEISSSYVNDHYEEVEPVLRDLIEAAMAEHVPRLAVEHGYGHEIDPHFFPELGERLFDEAVDTYQQAQEIFIEDCWEELAPFFTVYRDVTEQHALNGIIEKVLTAELPRIVAEYGHTMAFVDEDFRIDLIAHIIEQLAKGAAASSDEEDEDD